MSVQSGLDATIKGSGIFIFSNLILYCHSAVDNSYAPVRLFTLQPSAAVCKSSCGNNIDRENVKWCVRIADPDRNIETCISLNGTQKVIESTCDAEPLNLEPYLSLPDVRPHTFVHAYTCTCTCSTHACRCTFYVCFPFFHSLMNVMTYTLLVVVLH